MEVSVQDVKQFATFEKTEEQLAAHIRIKLSNGTIFDLYEDMKNHPGMLCAHVSKQMVVLAGSANVVYLLEENWG